MNKTKLCTILVGAIGAMITSAQAVHTLGYDFDFLATGPLAEGASIANTGSVGGPGTFHLGGGTGTVVNTGTVLGTAYGTVNLGNTLTLTPAADNNQNLGAPNIDANAAVSLFGITPGTAYTAFAWVNMASNAGDNMIFGGNGDAPSPNGQVLHHGTRNGNVHSGHWGDDLGPDQAVNIGVANGQWHVLAFTNDGPGGTQTIYLDPGTGSEVTATGAGGAGGGMQTAINLLIGTANNGGSFNGQMDRVTTYAEVRTPAQIAAAATAAPVPEPTAFVAVASGAAMLLGLRRRRS